MKRINLLALVLVSVLAIAACGGCVTSPTSPNTPDQNMSSSVERHARFAVYGYLLSTDDAGERSRRATRIVDIAKQVSAATDSQLVTTDIRHALTDLVLARVGTDPAERPIAQAIVDDVVAELYAQLGVDPVVIEIPADLLPETRKLIRSGADAARQAAQPFAR